MILVNGNDYTKVINLDDYNPFNKGNNPKFNQFSKNILNLKEGNKKAFNYFFDMLKNTFTDDIFSIASVPSSTAGKTSGICKFAKILANNLMKIDATSCLVRHTTVPPSHSGGLSERTIEKHLKSISVNNIEFVNKKDVLLLDDVTTTQNSMLACKQLLLNNGASNVQCYALGRTVSNS